MSTSRIYRAPTLALGLFTLSAVAAGPLAAGGFLLFEQASKPAALGGAFVAQADDPSAMFYNVGGLALLGDKPQVTAGIGSYSRNEALYQGLPPGGGEGTTGEQESATFVLPHAYLAQPLGQRIKVGLGLYQPFLLDTDWAEPDSFAGRAIVTRAKITTLDLNPSIAFKLTDSLGFGFGAIYRTSSLLVRRREQRTNPFTGALLDVASLSVDTAMDDGFGWNTGFLHRIGRRLSWGAAYRSEIEIDASGEGRLTQIPTGNVSLDELLRVTLPFDQDLGVTSAVTFPDQLSLGVALRLAKKAVLEVDLVQTGWSSFQQLALNFASDPEFSRTLEQNFEDTDTLRAGLRLANRSGAELRFGIAIDESPQPEATVGPLLADADSTSFSVGVGKEPLDLSFVWTSADRRTVTSNVDDFNGNHSGNSWWFGITISK